MNITIIGTGFVGVVSSAVFASFGHQVYGLDIDQAKIDKLNQGVMPFYEPGLEQLVKTSVAAGKLKFTTAYQEAITASQIVVIAVGTPSAADGQADLKFVFAAAQSLAPYLQPNAIVAIKSTVPPGTCDKVKTAIAALTQVSFACVSLPEFLREGSAVEDTLHPDRIVIGATDPAVIDILTELHKPFNAPCVIMRPESAQMCKYASNSYLATRITFINQIANLCEANGANVLEVIKGIGMDKRIGDHYWYPGLGYGGSCFPKDVKELAAYARAVGQEDNLMVVISKLNEERILKLLEKFAKSVSGWQGKKVAVLGLSFKPNTDDMREAPSTKVVPELLAAGAMVQGYDPMANEAAGKYFATLNLVGKENLQLSSTIDEAVAGAQVILILVEWPQLIQMDLNHIKQVAGEEATLIDCRDQYRREQVESVGLKYIGIGV